MKEIRFFYAPRIEDIPELPAEEAAHAVRVLRMSEGDRLLVTDGKGHLFEAVLTQASCKHCRVRVERHVDAKRLWRGRIELAVAPTKNIDRMEWLAEKATEIGIDRLAFLNCRNSERKIMKCERVEKIIVSAMKQSHKAWKPEVSEITDFGKFIQEPFSGQRFIAHCHDDTAGEQGRVEFSDSSLLAAGIEYSDREIPFLGDIIEADGAAQVLIGPEGDFSIEEVRQACTAGFRPVSLGRSRLRTETAALLAVHLLYLHKMY